MPRIQLLDYARLAAALAVVLFHYTYNGIKNGKIGSITHVDELVQFTRYGYLGVEFFFMISGYVIFYSARERSASEFAVSRIKRLYPAYWAAIIFTSIFAYQFGGELMGVNGGMIAANFTMAQNYLGFENVDGVYWTLFYELKFYIAVFVLLFLGLRKWLGVIFLIWPLMIVGCHFIGLREPILLADYHYLYFAAGGILAMLNDRFSIARVTSLMIVFFACLWTSAGKLENWPVVVIISTFFAFFMACGFPAIREMRLPYSRLAGSITYPLYLIHAHFGYMMIDRFATDSNKLAVYLMVVLVISLVAWSMHYLVEVKLAGFWNTFFEATIERPIAVIQSGVFEVYDCIKKKWR